MLPKILRDISCYFVDRLVLVAMKATLLSKGPSGMNDHDSVTIADLEIMTQAVNYQNWIYRRIEPYLGQRILEVGAGIGNFTRLLLDRELVVPTDVSESCVRQLRERLGVQLRVQPEVLDLGNPTDNDWNKHSFDTVICMNVLEHVEDDARALSFINSVLVPGGRAAILVPAFMFLFGSIDTSIGHFRRYTRRTLVPRMLEAGFVVESTFYMNVIGMAGWFWNNRVRRIKEENAAQIGLFDRYIARPAERFERLVPPPFGLSLIAIGRKQ